LQRITPISATLEIYKSKSSKAEGRERLPESLNQASSAPRLRKGGRMLSASFFIGLRPDSDNSCLARLRIALAASSLSCTRARSHGRKAQIDGRKKATVEGKQSWQNCPQ
jgi:hypothetical protein